MYPILLDFTIPVVGMRVVLPTYGFFLALAFAAAIQLGHFIFTRQGYDAEMLGNLYLAVILSSIAGARLTYVALEWDRFSQNPLLIFLIWRGGLVFYGGLVGGFLGGLGYALWAKQDPWTMADVAAPCIVLGHILGRVGCYLNGCCFGVPTKTGWGCVFPNTAHDMELRHPTQLYEAFGLTLLFILLLVMLRYRDKYKTFPPGTGGLTYVTLYAPLRYVVELYRGDDRGGVFLGFSISQLTSLILAVLVVVGWTALFIRTRGLRAKKV
jgi:phosphatidylglycerol:prolipoprotein diacylglycerol transferase